VTITAIRTWMSRLWALFRSHSPTVSSRTRPERP
jgi:hypothetical protein